MTQPTNTTTRPLHEIATDIHAHWPKVNFAAKPYLAALTHLHKLTDNYGHGTARSIVLYFLSNASTWRGPAARRIKAELNNMLKD